MAEAESKEWTTSKAALLLWAALAGGGGNLAIRVIDPPEHPVTEEEITRLEARIQSIHDKDCIRTISRVDAIQADIRALQKDLTEMKVEMRHMRGGST